MDDGNEERGRHACEVRRDAGRPEEVAAAPGNGRTTSHCSTGSRLVDRSSHLPTEDVG
jgi:hypothetical protein